MTTFLKIYICKYQEHVCVQIWHFQLFPNIRGSIYLFSNVVKCRSFLCSLRFCFHFSQIWEAAFTFLAMLRLNMASNPENPLNAILLTAENDIWQNLSNTEERSETFRDFQSRFLSTNIPQRLKLVKILTPHKNVPHLFTTSVNWLQQIYLALRASLYPM